MCRRRIQTVRCHCLDGAERPTVLSALTPRVYQFHHPALVNLFGQRLFADFDTMESVTQINLPQVAFCTEILDAVLSHE